MWDILVFHNRYRLTRDSRLFISLRSEREFEIRVAGDLLTLGLFWSAIWLYCEMFLAAIEFGCMMVPALRIQRSFLAGSIIFGISSCSMVVFFILLPIYAASIFETPLVESSIRRMPVNVSWRVEF
jgi:hypothetical protein